MTKRPWLATCLAVSALAFGSVAAQQPQYDVITVKPHDPADNSMSIRFDTTSYSARNIRLDNLIADAYGVKIWLVSGLPAWAKSSAWDIDAKITEPPTRPLTKEERSGLMQGLLKQRFGLVAHEEHRLQPVFDMTVMPNGPVLKPTPPGPPGDDGKPSTPRGGYRTGRGVMEGSLNMQALAGTLSYMVERTVIDRTGLTDSYDVTLRWSPDTDAAPNDNGTGDAPPALMEALQQQLGLKLTSGKAEVPTVVVDTITQPEAN